MPQGPHSHILMTGGGGPTGFIFYTPKNHNFKMCLPKKITTFFSIPQKIPWSFFRNPKKSLCFFLRPKKIPAYFIDPKKSLWAKISDPKKSLGTPPPVIKICEWGPWVLCSIQAKLKLCTDSLNYFQTFLVSVK